MSSQALSDSSASISAPAPAPVNARDKVGTVAPSPKRFANQREPGAFKHARGHSTLVKLLKLLLPVGAACLCLAFVGSAFLSYSPSENLSMESVGLDGGRLVMNQPKMAGFDKNNQPYDVKADRAIQDLSVPGLVELEIIDAKIPLSGKGFAEVDAKSGTYNSREETLVLRDDVQIVGAQGMSIFLESANIDMKSGTMNSSDPVRVDSKDTTISANSLAVDDNGKRIIFKDRVRMTITRPVERGVADKL